MEIWRYALENVVKNNDLVLKIKNILNRISHIFVLQNEIRSEKSFMTLEHFALKPSAPVEWRNVQRRAMETTYEDKQNTFYLVYKVSKWPSSRKMRHCMRKILENNETLYIENQQNLRFKGVFHVRYTSRSVHLTF